MKTKETTKPVTKTKSMNLGIVKEVSTPKINLLKIAKENTPKEAKGPTKKVNYLGEGITGKMLTEQKIAANRSNKDELNSISFNIKQLVKHSQELIKVLKIQETEITPANLLKYRTDKEINRMDLNGGKIGFWLCESLLVRYAKAK